MMSGFVAGAWVKIGFFVSNHDLRYQDEVHGNLFVQVDAVLDLLYTKYLKAVITYEGLQRVETFPYPRAALREALLNAVVHRDYSTGVPIQISVYDHQLVLWNPGHLSEDWSVEPPRAQTPQAHRRPWHRRCPAKDWNAQRSIHRHECRHSEPVNEPTARPSRRPFHGLAPKVPRQAFCAEAVLRTNGRILDHFSHRLSGSGGEPRRLRARSA